MVYLRAKDGLIFSICTTQEERKERKELTVVVNDSLVSKDDGLIIESLNI